MIDWATLTAEEVLVEVSKAPRVAGVWQYSDLTRGYQRRLLWHPDMGAKTTWLDVASLWALDDRRAWHGCYNFPNINKQEFGPFPDRFSAAAAVDAFLEKEGWKLCK